MIKKTAVKNKAKKACYVIDTNVPIHDYKFYQKLGDNDVIIPICVIEELDKFKKGKETRNFNTREFLRAIEALPEGAITNGGVSIGKGKGFLKISLGEPLDEKVANNAISAKSDVRILNTAYSLHKKNKKSGKYSAVVFVSMDVNLRLRARSLGLRAENYGDKEIENLNKIYTGERIIEGVDQNVLLKLYKKPFSVSAEELSEHKLIKNENLILKCGSSSVLAFYNSKNESIDMLQPRVCCGVKPRNAEQIFALNVMLCSDIPLVTITGKAGTGKTLLALAAALENKKFYRQIFVARPIVPLSNKDIGFLPGDVASKIDPYMQPLYDNLAVIQENITERNKNEKKIKELIEEEKIVVTPLSYIRGRSIVRVFFIVDEAQNLTPHEVKTIITRAGEGTKIVFTGDIHQIDHPYLDEKTNGLTYILEKMKGQELYAHINLEKGERSELAELASQIL